MFPDQFETRRLILRPVEADDAEAVFEGFAQDPAVSRYLIWRPHSSIAESHAFIARCLARPSV